jgi:predicted nucleic-acid-binding Zn-ribbon protein
MAGKIIQAPNCRKCAAQMAEKSSTQIPGTTVHRVIFVCENCGIESIMTTRL